MNKIEAYVNPKLCPLCNKSNSCGNISSCVDAKKCWCKNKEISFPITLLNKIPQEAKNKACICKACALAHH